MTPLCIIPARSGSKRLPGKNWMTVGGKTLVERAVECAVGAGLEPMLVTDAPELYAIDCARLIREPGELAEDQVAMVDVLKWIISGCTSYTEIVLLQPTSPLRVPEDVRACLRIHERSGCDSVVSVVARIREAIAPGPDPLGLMAEEHRIYERNGAVYVTTPELIRSGQIIGGWTQFYVMPPERSVDVDTEADLNEARRIAGDVPC